ncbi:tRNA(fMet)-specific endonuclease VapC [Thiohalophilus thiocyanatoxydans]|uniref:Ribonuclease VapC n=2 Tax=Thiohalophilus thiocyanatoxydans TaxID=381308 RepID=A0A4R8IP63_9GAMM|nr:type II toxin-antitoxin system VapC family toxin [Thiohalophilus thiocyanatoxydans]TDY02701.1 tRNA(fMet)-specific endonuclease VapC [Thiohalophilus thiocyanatoxydans]
MMVLLDTNVCIHFLNGNHPRILQHFQSHSPDEIALCSVVKAELLYGAQRSARVDANQQRLRQFFAPLRSVPFDDTCAEHYALIRADLAAQSTPIGPNDLIIAATARAHNLTLVTHNTAEFSRVAGLTTEDWEQ